MSFRTPVPVRKVAAQLARAAALGLMLAVSASAQQLNLAVLTPTLSGADAGHYFVDDVAVDLSLSIVVGVATQAQALDFEAELAVVGLDAASCSDLATLPAECVLRLERIAFDASEIAIEGQLAIPKQVDIALSPVGADAFDGFVASQVLAGRSIQFRLFFDRTDVYPVDPGSVPVFAAPVELLPLSGLLRFADNIQTHLLSFVRGGNCPTADGWTVSFASAEWRPGSDPSWETENVFLSPPDCVEPIAGDQALDLQLSAGSAQVSSANGEIGGLPVTLVNTVFTPTAVSPGSARIELPADTSVHVRSAATGLPLPRGSGDLTFFGALTPDSGDFDDLDVSLNASLFLRAEGLPFSFEVDEIGIGASGLSAHVVGTPYHYDLPFAAQDPRRTRGARSNDARFRRSSVPADATLTIDGDGLHATAAFLAGTADTHYPRTETRFGATTVEVAASALVGGQVLPLAGDRYRFDQLPYCAGCPDAGEVPRFDVPVAQGQGLAADGAVLARTGAIGENAEWGPEDLGSGNRVFARRTDQSLAGAMYLPGFRALGTATSDDVPGYLLGAREGVTADGAFHPGALFPLDHFQARVGNHFHPGLTVGPERLVGATGAPEIGEGVSLAGRATRIGFGGPVTPDFENVIGNLATKYVVREGGVTFVLNTDTPPQPIVYGHQLDVRRFAVRGIANALERESWFDATVHVPAPGDFEVSFSSLALECTGDVGGGQMDIEACNDIDDNDNGVVDENCDERLLAWHTPLSVRNAEFKRVIEGGQCDPGGRDFYVLGRIEPRAFDESMMLGAFWDGDGTPYEAHFEGGTNRKLDRPAVFSGSDESRAFDIAIDSDVELALTPSQDEGWFRLDGLIGLPFWEDAPVDLRIQNRSEDEPAQTLVFRQGTLENIPSQELVGNDDPGLIAQMRNVESTHARAHYEWGATELELDLPIYYDDGRHDEARMPRFLGIPERKNLSIFDADAGVNFATPETTRVSFGATANFDPLADEASELATFLDLNQPGCAGAAPLDSFLNEFFFVSLDGEGHGPIYQLCQGVSEAQDLLACWSGGGLEICMEQALATDLRAQLGDPDGVAEDVNQARLDALLGVMNPVVQIQTLISTTTSPANYTMQDQQMVALYDNLPLPGIPPVGGLPDIIQLQRANPALVTPAMLGNLQDALDLASAPLAGISTNIGQAQVQLGQAQADVDAVFAQLLADLDVAVAQIAAAQAELESGPLQLCSEANSVLAPAADARDQIESLLDKLGGMTKNLRLVFELFEFDGKKVQQALNAFVSYGNDVDTAAGNALAGIEDLLACDDPNFDQGDLQALFNGVVAEIEALRAAVEAMGPATKAFRDRLLVDTNAAGAPDGGWIGPGGSVDTELADALAVVGVLQNLVDQLAADTDTLIAGYPMAWPINPYIGATANQTRVLWDQHVSIASAGRYVWFYPGAGGAPDTSVVNALTSDATNSLLSIQSEILQTAQASLVPVLDLVPRFDGGDGLVAWIVGRVMGLPETEAFVTRAHELLDEPVDAAIDLVVHMLDNVETLMRKTLAALGTFEDRFFKVTDSGRLRLSRLGHFDDLTGYAVIQGDDLERLHMVANFDFLHEMFDGLLEMPISIDVTRWSSYNEVSASCMRNVPVRTLKDTTIRAEGYFGGDGANILGAPIGLDSLLVKNIDQAGNQVASVGGFGVLGDLPIAIPGLPAMLTLHDLRATWGDMKLLRFCEANPDTICWHDNWCPAGDTCSPAPLESWGHCNSAKDTGCATDDDCAGSDYCILAPRDNEDFSGARVKASLSGTGAPLDVAVFEGRTCSREPIEALDPQAAEFISFIDGRFRGVYVRGGVSFPIIPGGCLYNVKVGADTGVWGTWSGEKISSTFDSVGALVSGHASGRIACLAGLRGQVTMALEGVPGVGPTLGGEAFGVAGLGFDCDPDTWDSVQRSRSDRWCATVDGRALVVFRKGKYERGSLSISGIH